MKSYNGWDASTNRSAIGVHPFEVAGVDFPGGVRSGEVATVLGYVALQFHERVEHLHSPGCWGYSYRKNRNADNLSCHASGTAIDCNAPAHPNGVPASRTFTEQQMDEIDRILSELSYVVRWGGHFKGTPDAMHFEISGTSAQVAAVAKKLTTKQEDDMPLTDDDIKKIVQAVWDAPMKDGDETVSARVLLSRANDVKAAKP